MWKKVTALMLSICLLCTLIVPAAAAQNVFGYESAAFLGDSISLGFSFSNDDLSQAYEFERNVYSDEVVSGGNSYNWAYPFGFAKKAGIPLENLYNYGISGAMADDMLVLLKTEPENLGEAFDNVGSFSALREQFAEQIVEAQEESEFLKTMQENVFGADLVALAIGGNDIYQNFVTGFQNVTRVDEMGVLGLIVNIMSLMMQFEQPLDDAIETLKSYLEPILAMMNAGGDEENGGLLAAGASGIGGGSGMGSGDSSGISEMLSDGISQLADYFSEENIYNYFFDVQPGYEKSIVQSWKDAYTGVVATIAEKNPEADIALISQYNPLGVRNYLQLIRQEVENGTLLRSLGKNAYTAARIVKTLLAGMDEATLLSGSGMNERVLNAFAGALGELLPLFGENKPVYEYTYEKSDGATDTDLSIMTPEEYQKDHSNRIITDWVDTGTTQLIFTEDENDDLYELILGLSYPVMSLMVGNGLAPIYKELNNHIRQEAAKYEQAIYVDITDAPSSGRMDPHPGRDGHNWIAQRIYDEMMEAKFGISERKVEDITKKVVAAGIALGTAKTLYDHSKMVMNGIYATMPTAAGGSSTTTGTVKPSNSSGTTVTSADTADNMNLIALSMTLTVSTGALVTLSVRGKKKDEE